MKKFLIETSVFLFCLGISILIFYVYLDKQVWQHSIQQEGFWPVLKPVAKWILALTFFVWIISAGVRAIISTIMERQRSKNNHTQGNGK
jgi:hypothetical protein